MPNTHICRADVGHLQAFCSTSETADESRCQLSSSFSSCRRPVLVSVARLNGYKASRAPLGLPGRGRPGPHEMRNEIGEFRFWKSAHGFWKPRRALARKLGETHRLLRATSWPCGCSVQGITQG